MVLPPSKRQKAPKMAWTRCPSHFFTIPPSATSCTHRLTCRFGRCFCTLCRGLHRRPAPFPREAKRFIYYIRCILATLSTVCIRLSQLIALFLSQKLLYSTYFLVIIHNFTNIDKFINKILDKRYIFVYNLVQIFK